MPLHKICGVPLKKDPSKTCPYPAKYNGKCGIHDHDHPIATYRSRSPSPCAKQTQSNCIPPACEWLKERDNYHGVHTKAYCRKPVFLKNPNPKPYRQIFRNPSSICKGMTKQKCDNYSDECVWTHESEERSRKYPHLPQRIAHCRKKPVPPIKPSTR